MVIYIIATVTNNYKRATDFLEFQEFLMPYYRIGTTASFFRHIKLCILSLPLNRYLS
jgi:hypothetical protein